MATPEEPAVEEGKKEEVGEEELKEEVREEGRNEDEAAEPEIPPPPPTAVTEQEINEENVRLLKDRVSELEAIEVELADKLLRAQAEMANQRKRSLRQQDEIRGRARSDVILRFIEVVDNFDRATRTARESDKENPVVAGFLLVANQYQQIMFDLGVEKFVSKGEIYNPHRHEALSVFEQPELQKEIVLDEIRSGYLLNGELLRPAQVAVGKPAPPPDEDPDRSDE